MKKKQIKIKYVLLIIYFIILLIPIYWMLNISFKPNIETQSKITYIPETFTLESYIKIFNSSQWRQTFLQTFAYVILNVGIVLVVSLPAAYAFSRYNFFAKNHLFFWLLTNRMAPGAAFTLPIFILFSILGLVDNIFGVALAHCLFNIPLSIWILEGFISGIPKQIDETAFIDGHNFISFFSKIFLPLIAPGIGVTAFFAFMFSWVELLFSSVLTSVKVKPIAATLSQSLSAAGWDWGVIAGAGILTMIPGIVVIYFVRNYMVKGFSLGRV
jgi:glycerol transport system permease protein